jgi:diguanylate cyclase (GGDEF)-like protein
VDYICLVDAQGALGGIVSYTDLAGSIDPDILVETQRIGDLFRREKSLMVDCSETTRTVFDRMKAQNQSAAIIFEGQRAIGILTQKDVIRLLGQRADLDRPVGAFMSSPLISIPDTLTIKEALGYCREHKIKRIVVHGSDGGIMGIISQKDLVTTAYNRWAKLIKDHQRELKELNRILEERTVTLEKLASTDSLTGLFNRHMFSELFVRELAQSRRYKTPLSLILFDIDHFKKINDTHGHLIGDEALKAIAALTQANVRISDIIARWGGEEFAVMLPHTDIKGAHITAEKIRSAIETAEFEQVGRITASFGVAQLREDESQDPFFDRADKALYRAKVAGRNRVELDH